MTIDPLRLRPVFNLAIQFLNRNNFELNLKKLESPRRKPVNKVRLGKSDFHLSQVEPNARENRDWHIEDFKNSIQNPELGEPLRNNGFGRIHALLDKEINDIHDRDIAIIKLAWKVFCQQYIVENDNEKPEGCYQSLDEFSESDKEQAFEEAKKIFPNQDSDHFVNNESYNGFLKELETVINISFKSVKTNEKEPQEKDLLLPQAPKKVIRKKPFSFSYGTATIFGTAGFAVAGLAGVAVPLALELLSTHYTAGATTIALGALLIAIAIVFAVIRTLTAPENKRPPASPQSSSFIKKYRLSEYRLSENSDSPTPTSSPVSATSSKSSDIFGEDNDSDAEELISIIVEKIYNPNEHTTTDTETTESPSL